MKIFVVLFVLLLPVAKANSVRNGGDVITCSAAPAAKLVGAFTLDYVATYDFRSDNADVHLSGESFGEVLSELESRFQKIPILGEDFRTFVHDFTVQYYMGPSPSVKNMWVKRELGLIDLDDQSLVERLPDNCYSDPRTAKARLQQAVVQERRPGVSGISYYYDPKVLEDLATRPLQLSFLLVHEWLWRYAGDAGVVRVASRLLHSDRILKMSGNEILFALNNLGLRFSKDVVGPTAFPIEIRETSTLEPHRRRKLALTADWFVVPEKSTRLRFVNRTPSAMDLRRLEDGSTLCHIPAFPGGSAPESVCEVGIDSGLQFPIDLFFERQPLVDPPYDTRHFSLLH